MKDCVKIVECPRDAWQGLGAQIPASLKARYLQRLIHAGFRHIDAVSFVSPAAVPQMADSEDVLQALEPAPRVEIIGIVVNRRGADRAIDTGKVQTLGFPYSISPTFLERNQNQTPAAARATLNDIAKLANLNQLGIVTYVSMAFGNPYEEPWSVHQVLAACAVLADSGVRQISLADTVGLATPAQISGVFAAAFAAHPTIEFGVHLHARRESAPAMIHAAYAAGCRRFDSAIGGLGGCPFAQDTLVGNIPTETLLAVLTELGASLPDLELDDTLIQASVKIARKFSAPVLSKT